MNEKETYQLILLDEKNKILYNELNTFTYKGNRCVSDIKLNKENEEGIYLSFQILCNKINIIIKNVLKINKTKDVTSVRSIHTLIPKQIISFNKHDFLNDELFKKFMVKYLNTLHNSYFDGDIKNSSELFKLLSNAEIIKVEDKIGDR